MKRGIVSLLASQLRRCEIKSPRYFSRSFHSIEHDSAQDKIMEKPDSEPQPEPRIFVMDTETTGLDTSKHRIIEFAIKDLSGGSNNTCFQTLVNPQQLFVPNSHIHGISTEMVSQPGVPRIGEMIHMLLQYFKNCLTPGDSPLIVAHNARSFDVQLLIHEFKRCGMVIPSSWQFLDSLSLAQEYMEAKGLNPRNCSLKALCQYYGLKEPLHRAMSDVDRLSTIFLNFKSEMELTNADLLQRSFKASDPIKSSKKKIITKV